EWTDLRPPVYPPANAPAAPPSPPAAAARAPLREEGGKTSPLPAEGFDEAEATTRRAPVKPPVKPPVGLPPRPPAPPVPPSAPPSREPSPVVAPSTAARTNEERDRAEQGAQPRPPDPTTRFPAGDPRTADAPSPALAASSPAPAVARADNPPAQPLREAADVPPRLLVEVLGPCRVTGPGSARLRPRDVEVLVYLALAENPVTNDDIRAAIAGPSDSESNANTVRTWLSRIRSAVGTDVLPDAEYGRYRLAAVATDHNRFQELRAEAAASTDRADTLRLLADAIKLVRGRPFDDTDYRWTHMHIASLETAIADAADRLCTIAIGRHDPATASWAAERGLAAVGHPDDRLLAHLLGAAAQQGPAQLAQAWRQVTARCASAGDAPTPELAALHDQLRTGMPR
ncbi:MAG: AfsR/SARP family transcriptional regulator, partial [Acidimicrobiales bacterium]